MEKELYYLFKKAHPETVGETDKEFDRYNYMEWLEKHVESLNYKVKDLEEVLEDKRRLTLEIERTMFGDESAINPSLGDVLKSVIELNNKYSSALSRIYELERRHAIIMSEPYGIIRDTMMADLLID